MAEKMTIHRALVELKTLDKRINSAISEGTYIAANKKSNKKINGMSIKDFEDKVMKASFDKVMSLIIRRNNIKSAIVTSNATKVVEIAGVKMTVAEAIERKNSIEYDRTFLGRLQYQYNNAVGGMNNQNALLTAQFEKYLSTFGGKEALSPEAIEQHRANYFGANEYELVDPLQLGDKITALTDKITSFYDEVDAVLSESNALTFIEF